jgi:hypothetical protein
VDHRDIDWRGEERDRDRERSNRPSALIFRLDLTKERPRLPSRNWKRGRKQRRVRETD